MSDGNAKKRAILTSSSIINSRSLTQSHKRLAGLLQEDFSAHISVLDVGCGTGSITFGIAEAVGQRGKVVGIDNNRELLQKAKEKYGHLTQISFIEDDIYQLKINDTFNIISCSRVLQWLSQPSLAIKQLSNKLVEGGTLVVLDYNHTKVEWYPVPPPAFLYFYDQFLKWRAEVGMDNEIADKLATIFEEIELNNIQVTTQHEITSMSDFDFFDKVNIWSLIMESRGKQMLADGVITELQLDLAKKSFLYWLHNNATSQKLYLLSVEGQKRKLLNTTYPSYKRQEHTIH